MSEIHVFTSAAANYLPKVRVLFDSIKRHHPEWTLHLCLVEDLQDAELSRLDVEASVVQVRDLDIPDWRPWAFGHSIVELCTAVKPFMLKRLLQIPNAQAVLYFDPDIALYSRLDDLLEGFSDHSILLTPHQTSPEVGLESVISQEITSLKYGIYNLGFVGVKASHTGPAFAEWWASRLYHFCRDDVPNGLFTDQRWIDLVPAMFDGVGILRKPRFNVAAWNWTTRELSKSSHGGLQVDGEPLGFYHFTGIDSGNHDLRLAKFPAQRQLLEGLIDGYRESVSASKRQPPEVAGVFKRNQGAATCTWSFAEFDDGQPIKTVWRRLYRDSQDLQRRFSDPWCGGQAFLSALQEQSHASSDAGGGVGFGYVGQVPKLDRRRLAGIIVSILRRPQTIPSVWRQLGNIRRDEGWAGVRRRLSRGPGD